MPRRRERAPEPAAGGVGRHPAGTGSPSAQGSVAIPDKPYFRIGEVARLLGVEAHVLRYWERAFPSEIRPTRSGSNHRVYRRADVEKFAEIKTLRYDEQVGVAGARRRLRVRAGAELGPAGRRLAEAVRAEIAALTRIIDEDEADE